MRPRCRCGVYIDCHQRITNHRPRRASRLRLWFQDHSVADHLVAPIWVRLPEKWRWTIVSRLNKSQTRCWSSLVDAALCIREDDACDVSTPLRCSAGDCSTTCYWSDPDHTSSHDCGCYCGKFRFVAAEGAIDRRTVTR